MKDFSDKNTSKDKEINELDSHVGRRLKQRREKLGLSQTELSNLLDISYQQVQKYERGENKIPAGRLYQLANALKVTPDYFFEGAKLSSDGPQRKKYLQLERERPLNILIVEDNPVDEMLTRDAITASGLEAKIFVVHDGGQAMDYLKNQDSLDYSDRTDIVLLDINIPKRNGLEVLKEVKRDRTIQHIPIIMLTNSINPEDMEASYKQNASGYVSKSFNVAEFNDKIALIVGYWSKVAVLPSMQY